MSKKFEDKKKEVKKVEPQKKEEKKTAPPPKKSIMPRDFDVDEDDEY